MEHHRVGPPAHPAYLGYGLRCRALALAIFPARSRDRPAHLVFGAVDQNAARRLSAAVIPGHRQRVRPSAAPRNDVHSVINRARTGGYRRITLAGHGVVARAAMTPAPSMQRKAVRLTVVAVRLVWAIRAVRAICSLALLRGLLLWRLAAGDE